MNITSINATENDTVTLEQNNDNLNIDDNIMGSDGNQDKMNQKTLIDIENNNDTNCNNEKVNQEILTTAKSEDTVQSPPDSNYYYINDPEFYHAQFSLTINDTTSINTTKNVTFNIHLEWDLYMGSEVYDGAKILVYDNDNILHSFKISDLSGEYSHNAHDIKDIILPYTIKDMTEIKAIFKTSLFELQSPLTFSFEELKNITFTNL